MRVATTSLCDTHKTKAALPFHVVGPDISCRNSESTFFHSSTPTCMVGKAYTAQCNEPNDFLAVIQGLDECPPGHVLVVNTMNPTKAVAGGLFLMEAANKALAGIVIDGPVRDLQDVKSSYIPMFAKSITPTLDPFNPRGLQKYL